MPFPRKLLYDTEEIVLDLHPHWWYMAPQGVAAVAAIVLYLVLLINFGGVVGLVGLIIALAGLGWFALRYASWWTTNFVVTTDRVIYRHGVLTKTGIEIPLERVNNVLFHQRFVERILGHGDLVIESAGESGQQSFSDVRKPSAVQNEIYRQMEANENRKFDRVAEGINAGALGGTASVADELRKLDELRSQGILSDAEFQAQKQRLLGG